MTDIASVLKYILEERNMTQKSLAQAASTTEATVSRLINEKRRPASLDLLSNMADALGVSADYLLGRAPVENFDQKLSTAEALLISALRRAPEAEYQAVVLLMKQYLSPIELLAFEESEERSRSSEPSEDIPDDPKI